MTFVAGDVYLNFTVSRDTYVESELIYAYAKTSRYADLEEFVSSPNHADVGKIGDR